MPTEQTTMARAFANAKVLGPTLNPNVTRHEMVWRVVKEGMPKGMVLHDIKKRLHMVEGQTISAALHDMIQRGMVYTRVSVNPQAKPGTWVRRQVNTYYTDMERYEKLPLPAKPKAKPPKSRKTGDVPAPRPAALPQVAQPAQTLSGPVPGSTVDEWLETLTIAQARALHAKLEKMFRGTK